MDVVSLRDGQPDRLLDYPPPSHFRSRVVTPGSVTGQSVELGLPIGPTLGTERNVTSETPSVFERRENSTARPALS